jgi:dynamin 1-like protein
MLEGASEALPTNELAGGARVRHVFQDVFTTGLERLDPAR